MGKFCTKCGRPLQEGEICGCGNEIEEMKEKKDFTIDIKESFIDCFEIFKKVITKPFEAINNFVTENKYISGIIMMVMAALSTGIYKLAVLKNSYQMVESSLDGHGGWLDIWSNFTGESVRPAYFKEFLTETATNLIQYIVLVILGYLIISKLMNGKSTWKHILTAVGISLSVVIGANLMNSILTFINGELIIHLISYVSSFASIFSILLLYESVKGVAEVDKNKLLIGITSMLVCANIVVDFIQKIFS